MGYLKGSFENWKNEGRDIDTLTSVPASELEKQVSGNKVKVVDVRKPNEYENGHIAGAENIPLDFINEHMAGFPKDDTFYIHCAGGYRSVIASSILKSRGMHNMIDVAGGYKDIKQTGIKTETSSENMVSH